MRAKMAPVGVVAAVALTVAACGGSARMSKAAYASELRATIGRAEKQMQAAYAPLLAQSTSSTSTSCSFQGSVLACSGGAPTQSIRSLTHRAGRRVKAALESAAESLQASRPPSDAVGDNRALIAGLREVADLYGGLLLGSTTSQRALERKVEALREAPATKAFAAARADLERKGYELGFLTADLTPGSALERDTSGGSTGYGVAPNPRPVKPLPFSLVSAAGVQPASNLSAQANSCVTNGTGMACAMQGHLVEGGGPIPGHLSVVRPGEHLRFTGPASTKLPSVRVQGIGDVPGSLTATALCRPLARPVLDTFLSRPGWTAPRKPGAYVVSVTVEWPSSVGDAEETGLVGILVSRTHPLRVLPRPRCG